MMPYIILHQAEDEFQAEGYCEAYHVVDNDDLSPIMISMGLTFKRFRTFKESKHPR